MVASLGGKNSRTSQGLFEDMKLTFPDLFLDVLPTFGVFSDGDFREYAMFLASYRTINSIKFVYWILDLGTKYKILTYGNNDYEVLKFKDF